MKVERSHTQHCWPVSVPLQLVGQHKQFFSSRCALPSISTTCRVLTSPAIITILGQAEQVADQSQFGW